ncbi:hypothetical protein ON010_g17288 [Phytophthora cinnamomi]|nr:hypothetical protein ON010_g17288 [Phytophthora cinnamomi]
MSLPIVVLGDLASAVDTRNISVVVYDAHGDLERRLDKLGTWDVRTAIVQGKNDQMPKLGQLLESPRPLALILAACVAARGVVRVSGGATGHLPRLVAERGLRDTLPEQTCYSVGCDGGEPSLVFLLQQEDHTDRMGCDQLGEGYVDDVVVALVEKAPDGKFDNESKIFLRPSVSGRHWGNYHTPRRPNSGNLAWSTPINKPNLQKVAPTKRSPTSLKPQTQSPTRPAGKPGKNFQNITPVKYDITGHFLPDNHSTQNRNVGAAVCHRRQGAGVLLATAGAESSKGFGDMADEAATPGGLNERVLQGNGGYGLVADQLDAIF